MKEKAPGFVSIISGIVFFCSFVADVVGIFQQFKIVLEWAIAISALLMIAGAVYFFFREKHYASLINHLNEENAALSKQVSQNDETISQKIEEISQKDEEISRKDEEIKQISEARKKECAQLKELELKICDGKKLISSKATITFDILRKKYILSFEKRYVILSDAIKWYEGQFYSNKYLDSAETSQVYYKDHPIKWVDLNISAELRYKNPTDRNFSKTKKVAVLQIAEGNNYKKFHIQYKTKLGDKLPIRKGAEILLTYTYEIPTELWGSYLNRYISYWRETTEVILKCDDKYSDKLKDSNIKVYQTDHITGEPIITDIKGETDTTQGKSTYVIKLPSNESCKYAIWWDADEIFEESSLNTNMTVDHSQQTQY